MSKKEFINQIEPLITKKDADAVNKYLLSGGWVTEHKITNKFENLVKEEVARNYASAVPNGTIAIYLALLASGIKKGDKVAVPNLTMIATINAVLWAQAEPVLIDVNSSLCMSYEHLLEFDNINCVIYVPLNGRTQDGLKIEKWCKKNKIILIEDSAHALGSIYKENKKCGNLGDVSIFSFTPHKIITTGQGGMVLTNNKRIKSEIDKIKTFNRRKDKLDWHQGFGLNFKFTDLQASLGVSQFDSLGKHIKRKKKIYRNYKKIQSNNFEIGKFNENELPWFFDLYAKSASKIESITKKLSDLGIETRNLYPALSKQNYLKNVKKTDLSYSENIFNKVLWLPSSVNLELKNQNKIINVINED